MGLLFASIGSRDVETTFRVIASTILIDLLLSSRYAYVCIFILLFSTIIILRIFYLFVNYFSHCLSSLLHRIRLIDIDNFSSTRNNERNHRVCREDK